ncbi:sugar phosphate isomerase/epimerase family protein [Larkinella insperata]|uniref:Sugar phosphate isomerase/epimerase family protein n=1 Tax=Larkinella insperata TaxID=332158 RepID=A0ABW3Q240_9BACT|nr:sugar phosphate isomerase/epimerase family protein [Larkinella insperata]
MQLGVSSYTFGWAVGVPGHWPDHPLEEQGLLDKAVQAGVQLVQLGDNLPVHELSERRLQALRQRATRESIALELGARGLTPGHLHRYLRLCEHLNARLLRFVIDGPDYEPSVAEVVTVLKEAVPTFQKTGVTLGLENHDRLIAAEFATIVEQVGSERVGICLDSVNSMGAGEGLEQIVGTLAPYTVNLHLKDFGIQRLSHLMGFQIDGRPAGQGLLNIPWLLERIGQTGRCQTAILEQWVVPEASLDDTIAKENRWAAESLTYLRTLAGLEFSPNQATVLNHRTGK